MTRRPAVAGSWYPKIPGALTQEVDGYLSAAAEPPAGQVVAVLAPHAGIMFSGPVGAYAWKAAAAGSYDVVALVGPSHFSGFDGVALWPDGAFDTPLGPAPIDPYAAQALSAFPIIQPLPAPHEREHSLEMQLPFLRRLLPDVTIVPLLMGYQRRETIEGLAAALAAAFRGRRVLLVASTDLSHYFDATTAADLDGRVLDCVARFDPEGLLEVFEHYPEAERGRYVACGGGPAIAVMLAARTLGAGQGRVLRYSHSGVISGDYDGVVGYMAGAFGVFDAV